MFGSSDVGNVSQLIPTIQPTLHISDRPITPHTHEFRKACNQEMAYKQIAFGALLLGQTIQSLLQDPEKAEHIKKEHERIRKEHMLCIK